MGFDQFDAGRRMRIALGARSAAIRGRDSGLGRHDCWLGPGFRIGALSADCLRACRPEVRSRSAVASAQRRLRPCRRRAGWLVPAGRRTADRALAATLQRLLQADRIRTPLHGAVSTMMSVPGRQQIHQDFLQVIGINRTTAGFAGVEFDGTAEAAVEAEKIATASIGLTLANSG